MQSGVFWGYIGLIEGLIARIKAEWGKPMTVVGTGGVASLFHGATASIDHFDPDLTIRGMLEIYRRNTAAGLDGQRLRTTNSFSCRSAGPTRSG